MHCSRRLIPLITLFALGCGNAAPQNVVLYCAQDQEFAEATLADFQRATGLTVTPKFDTEADKSVSLVTDSRPIPRGRAATSTGTTRSSAPSA